jgi:hypothetical protein
MIAYYFELSAPPNSLDHRSSAIMPLIFSMLVSAAATMSCLWRKSRKLL